MHDRRLLVNRASLLRLVVVGKSYRSEWPLSRLLSPSTLSLAPNLDVHAPFDHPPNLFQRIYPNTVSPASNSNDDSAMLHHHDALERCSPYEGIWLWRWRGDQWENIQPLLMAQQQVMWRKERPPCGRVREMGRG